MSIKETKDGVLLSIYVKPKSPKFKIEFDGNEIVVHVTEEPERGKVNKEIIKEVRKDLGYNIEIVSGQASKQKVFLFRGVEATEVEIALKRLCGYRKIDKK